MLGLKSSGSGGEERRVWVSGILFGFWVSGILFGFWRPTSPGVEVEVEVEAVATRGSFDFPTSSTSTEKDMMIPAARPDFSTELISF